ncbi:MULTISPECIES: energy transducer TonB [Sphingobacterium]|uniref:energy transducer TonB n=1 Tax=Sphingobacterium TaxID=28453 RepID=UPI0013DB02AA|nr:MULTISPECIES: energy transducer TonB [unclassified Sphingobacterium]
MLFSESVIFNKEWMDVVFVGRNKAYGAYQLRLFGEKAIQISLGGVVLIVAALCGLSFIEPTSENMSNQPTATMSLTVVEVDDSLPLEEEIVRPKEPEGDVQQVSQDVPAVDLVKFTEINPTDAASVKEDVIATLETLAPKKMIAAISMKGEKGGTLIPKGTFGKEKREGASVGRSIGDVTGGGGKNGTFTSVEIMPMPPGGMKAFVDWVAVNYQFPSAAVDNEAAGVIQVSFVVEKDGGLSSFEVIRDLGFGTGDQAIKLLKKAKKWSPGIQNGIPVRVAYTLPIRLSTIQQ